MPDFTPEDNKLALKVVFCVPVLRSKTTNLMQLHSLLNSTQLARLNGCLSASAVEIETLAKKQGMRVLLDDGLEKVRDGITTPEEILRLLGPQVLND